MPTLWLVPRLCHTVGSYLVYARAVRAHSREAWYSSASPSPHTLHHVDRCRILEILVLPIHYFDKHRVGGIENRRRVRFVCAADDLTAQLAARPTVGEFQSVGPEPAHAHHCNQAVGQDSAYSGGGLQVNPASRPRCACARKRQRTIGACAVGTGTRSHALDIRGLQT